MKKSLSRILARMAKDGDVETVAEFIEEMIGEEAETPAEEVAEVVEAVAETAEEAPVIVEAPEAKEITIDEESIAGIIERLDKLIELLTPAAGDEDPVDPVEEIAEVVEEVIEAAEAEEGISIPAEQEVAEILETILEPEVSTTLEETEGDEGCEDPDTIGKDALRAALTAVRPALQRMNQKQRKKACADIAARMRATRKGSDGKYAALARAARKPAANPMDLGKRIMAARNANYHK